jgi:DnaJ homolog subfamily C member 19
MLWLLLGTAILTALLLGLRAFERAPVGTIYSLLKWIAAFGGIALTVLLFLSGRGPQALGGLVLVGPLLWRRWHQGGLGFGGFGSTGPTGTQPPPRQSSSMTRQEAYEVLGLKPGADAGAIHAAHRRLMRAAHPDAGGSDWLASRVNQARDVLLG